MVCIAAPVAFIAAALALLVAPPAYAAAKPPKAIIWMLGDDYGYANVVVHAVLVRRGVRRARDGGVRGFAHGPNPGNPEMRTPIMDSLVEEGLLLERHYVYKYCSDT